MKKHITIILVMLMCIQLLDKLLVYGYSHIPHSIPTPVENFMYRVAEIESNGNYKIVNRYGMMGLYQFNPSTVRGLGFKVSREQFLMNKHLQDSVMIAYMRANEQDLLNMIRRYEGRSIHGVPIHRATVLAGAHFAGSTNMRNYLASNGNQSTTDGNGTTITKYISHFRDVQLPSLVDKENQ